MRGEGEYIGRKYLYTLPIYSKTEFEIACSIVL